MNKVLLLLPALLLPACSEPRPPLVSPPRAKPPAPLPVRRVVAAPAAEAVTPYELVLSSTEAWLAAPGGARLLELRPELLAVLADEARPQRERRPLRGRPIGFSPWQVKRREAAGFLLEAQASAGPLRYLLRLSGEPGGRLEIELESEALQATVVRAEVLQLRSQASEAAVVDGALRWGPLRKESFAGLLDAQQLRLSGGAGQLLLVGAGLQGLRVRALPEHGFLVELELDHEANHPFRPLLACTARQTSVKRGYLDVTVRPAGSRRRARAQLLVGEVTLPLLGRYPRGARAAAALTDHADQSNAPKLEALAFGSTGAVDAGRLGPAYPGLVNRGLTYTKSIFLQRVQGYAKQLEEPTYRKLLERMTRSGVELALHSVSGKRDRPRKVSKLLPAFRSLSTGRTWIDHQPVTNCEALSNQGWDPRSPYHVLEPLVQAGVRHFWSGEDVPAPSASLNLLWAERAGSRRPIIYPFALRPARTAEDELWLFASTPFFLSRAEVIEDLSDPRLKRLELERGLFIGHVYLDTFHKKGGRFNDRSLLQFGDGPKRYRLRPEVDEVFQRLAAHQAAGLLWVTGIDALIDQLRGRAAVELRPGAAGEILVSSRASHSLSGLTLILPPDAGRVSLDGGAVAGQRRQAGEREIWFDLKPGATRRLLLDGRRAAPAPLVLREPHE